ncbi:hypothetical protein LCGC14_3021860 [marine sediment metagenome]|uniref:Uncharacterized protein n=1 Tax=marine sediment metagenome TaxID=412755 RepID=A0A0F8XI14_9ZZZZ
MNEILILFICKDCGFEHYFEINNLPGGDEHCEYCENCSGKLIKGK